ncbi:MAG: fumarylacetoacetate hydrolase family protein [Burkholderiales bacterium]|nr:fumarylacetoacetate hydrolase family protein [Burkholderiales bacterium]
MRQILLENTEIQLNNIYCIGRNYTEHIHELGNSIPDDMIVFMKPNNALLLENNIIIMPNYSTNVHYECEIVVYINKDADNILESNAVDYIGGIGIGLDLTARDTQDIAKSKGQPWLKAKGFKHSACLSNLIPIKQVNDINNIEFSLEINNKQVQFGNTKDMLYPIYKQIEILSHIYGLKSGDIIYTGTPSGVGRLNAGDKLQAKINGLIDAKWTVAP